MKKVLQVKGFAGFVAIVLQLSLTEGIDRKVYGTSGVLSNFEDNPPSDYDRWTITAPIGYRINVTIVYFSCPGQIELKGDLSNHKVECNSKFPSIFSTEQRVLQVNFTELKFKEKYFATFEALSRQNTDGCNNTWSLFDGSCYKLFHIKSQEANDSVPKAKEHCRKRGASLLTSVKTKQENDLLRALMKQSKAKDGDNLFIGHLTYYSSNQTFVRTADKTPFMFTSWIQTPSCSSFVALHKNGSWLTECKRSNLNFEYFSCKKKVLKRNMLYKECSRALIQGESMMNIRASTQNPEYPADKARLYEPLGWMPNIGDSQPWIEINFGSPFLITAVVTQGNERNGSWISRFSLSFTLYDNRYINFTNPRRDIVYFEGNRDAYNLAYNKLPYPLIAKTVRLEPEKWENHIGLRMEFYGCPSEEAYGNCNQPLGLESFAVHDEFMTSSSHDDINPPHNARLNIDLESQGNCWSPRTLNTDQWLQIDFRSNRTRVTAIAIQGRGDDEVNEWVTRYALSYAEYQDNNFTFYKENNVRKSFTGNSDKATVVKTILDPPLVVFALRIHPLEWYGGNISMRLELYGCQANDSYTAWSNWSNCNHSCTGHQKRTRNCTSSYPRDCPGSMFESRRCNIEACFSSWTPWTQCNQPCGNGTRNRTKYYLGDRSSSTSCNGSLTVIEECNTGKFATCNMTCGIGFKKCQVDYPDSSHSCETQVYQCNQTNEPNVANFTNWSKWGECTSTCGGIYYQNRTRSPTSNMESLVYNPEVESKECDCSRNESCNCNWSNWTICNTTCGGGVQSRVFNCSFTTLGLVNCSGSINESRTCNEFSCPVNGNFTEWSTWTICTETCGNGTLTQQRMRNCTNPPPAHGGNKCTGNTTETQTCRLQPCPVNGNFTEWSTWSNCTVTCGNGTQQRMRNCTNPPPAHGGKKCTGNTTETQRCRLQPCPVDGNFTEWSTWSNCNMTCGNGTQQRMRNCTNPTPAHGGKNCTGNTTETQRCRLQPCPVNGNFTEWSNWTNCTVTCGNGTQQRMRNCTNPTPAHGGKKCTGNTTETQRCRLQPCPVDGNFTEWSTWSNCNMTCGNGTQQRMRNCTNPTPAHGGKNCTGNTTETQRCRLQPCPVDGNFTEWSNWSNCTMTCGNGTQQRMRNFTNPPPAHGGKNCTGNTTETQRCRLQSCPVNGNFTEWSTWSNSTMTCGNGTQQRMRNCTNPPPAHGGKNCTGNTTETQTCRLHSCPDIPVDGNFTEWSEWTNCTRTCGTGTQERMRTCTSPPPANGGANCSGHTNETHDCNTHPCPIDGNWTSWSDWSYCNRPCGMGYENSTRSCTKPAPLYGGRDCEGPNNRSRVCNMSTCPVGKVVVAVHFTKENWTDDLKDLKSEASLKFKEKILENLEMIYYDYGMNVTDIELTSLRNGSVMAKFVIFFDKMDSLQLVILQERMQITGLLNSMPVRNTHFNTTKVPSLSPKLLTIKNQTSSSIVLSWTHVPSIYLKGQNLSGYTIFYKGRNAEYLPNQLKSVTWDNNNTFIDGLKKYSDYTLRILAFTKSGNGISSEPTDFRTDEDVPSEPPTELSITALSSTAISAQWNHIDSAFIHGILLGYNVTVTNLKSAGEKKYQLHGPTEIYSLVDNLDRYTEYLVEVCGYTSKGCGVTATDRVKTLEDAPTKPPKNVRTLDLSSTSELKVYWDEPEQDGINGILRGYTVQYKIISTSEIEMQEQHVFTKRISPSDHECTLTNLMSYTVYEIKIAARTHGGLGPFARVYGETCRCPETFNTNYWYLTPYLNKTSNGNVQGIFSHIIRNMITWACADCKNGHRKTKVDFKHDGSGSKSDKASMLDVISNVHHGAQVSFPINGNKYMTSVYGGQPFVPIVESPGVAFLALQRSPVSPAWNILKSVIGTMPFILFSLILAYLAGVVVWFLDSDAKEGSSFPRSFIKGANEGMWWSFISMTTVGYGDRSPTKFMSRLFAIIWTLYGMVLVSIITSAVTTSLTTVTVETTKKIYGLPVAAIENSSEHRLGLLMNGKVNQVRQYHSVEDIHEALVKNEVEGALIDTYVVATDIKRFTDDNVLVTRLLDRPFGYGIALSIGAASIEKKCRDYLKLHENKVISFIERSTGQLKKPDKSSSEEASSGLFDPGSLLYRNSALFVGCILLFAVLCGIVWHFTYNAKHINKVSSWERTQLDQQEKSRKILKKLVEEFYINITHKIEMMRKRHREERLVVCKREKEREKQEAKNEVQVEEDDDFNVLFKRALKLLKR